MYEINHKFKPETVEIAEEYKLVAINSNEFYKEVVMYFDHMVTHYGAKHLCLSNAFPYKTDSIRREYNRLFRKVCTNDRPHFNRLCRAFIYEYYFEQYVQPYVSHTLKDEVSICVDADVLWDDIEEHIDKANQHFRKVESDMNTLTKFQETPFADVSLIHGKPVEDYTESELVDLIRKARKSQADIADLVKDSKRMAAKHKELEEAITVYVSALDNMK